MPTHLDANIPAPPVVERNKRGFSDRRRYSLPGQVTGGPSDNVIAALPSSPDSQLEVGLDILRSAFVKRVEELQSSSQMARSDAESKRNLALSLQTKLATLEKTIENLVTTTESLNAEGDTLRHERDILTGQQKKISENVSKLQAFKDSCSSFLQDGKSEATDVTNPHGNLPPRLQALLADSSDHPAPKQVVVTREDEANVWAAMANRGQPAGVTGDGAPRATRAR